MKKYTTTNTNIFHVAFLGLLFIICSMSFPRTVMSADPIIIESPTPQYRGGFSRDLASGDVNGDGHDDIVVGTAFENKAHVFDGEDQTLLYSLILPDSVECFGPDASCRFGVSVWVADNNDDGIPYIIVGAPQEIVGGDTGMVYVYNGTDGSLLYTLTPDSPFQFFGVEVAAGDVNDDGTADILVSDSQNLFVFNGATREIIYHYETLAQTSLASVDVNSDGMDDIIVGNSSADLAYVMNGADGTLLFVMHLPDDAVCDLGHPAVDCNFGFAIAAGTDRYGAMIVVGASHEDIDVPDQGRVYVFDDTGDLVTTMTTPNPNLGCDTAECNRYGGAVDVGDVNNDNVLDIVVGANAEPLDGVDKQGRAYLYKFSASTYGYGTPDSYDSPSPIERNEVLFGSKVALGDTDADGNADVIVGSLWDDADHTDQGLVYLYQQQNFLPFLPIIERFPRRLYPLPEKYPLPDGIRISLTDIDKKYLGENGDWWILAETAYGWFHYDMLKETWEKGIEVSYQGSLYIFKEKALSMKGLPLGKYSMRFGIDMEVDYKLDKSTVFDSVLVKVEESKY